MELKNIDLRDEFFNDIHDMKPKWWMRWGILTVFIILLIILSLGYIIKYPDMIYSEIRLTTNKASVTFPLVQNAQIEKIFVNNNDTVLPNTNLLVIKNNSNFKDVFLLKRAIDKFSFERDSILNFFDHYLNYDLQLGDLIENDWNTFSGELLVYYKIEKLDSYQSQIGFLRKELARQLQLKKQYEQLIHSDELQKNLLNKKIGTDSILFSKGIISKMDYYGRKSDYYGNSKMLQQNSLELKRNNLEIVKLDNAIKNYGNNERGDLLSQKLNIRKSLNKLKSAIASWEKNYLLTSPISGKVSFIQNLKENSFYEGNVIVVTPNDKSFYATINIPFVGAGKVKKGQRVIIKLNDYPYREYGTLEGIIINYSPVAGEKYYLGKVEINKNNISSYGKGIKIKENMSGIGEIITNDRSVLGRLFEKILYAFKS